MINEDEKNNELNVDNNDGEFKSLSIPDVDNFFSKENSVEKENNQQDAFVVEKNNSFKESQDNQHRDIETEKKLIDINENNMKKEDNFFKKFLDIFIIKNVTNENDGKNINNVNNESMEGQNEIIFDEKITKNKETETNIMLVNDKDKKENYIEKNEIKEYEKQKEESKEQINLQLKESVNNILVEDVKKKDKNIDYKNNEEKNDVVQFDIENDKKTIDENQESIEKKDNVINNIFNKLLKKNKLNENEETNAILDNDKVFKENYIKNQEKNVDKNQKDLLPKEVYKQNDELQKVKDDSENAKDNCKDVSDEVKTRLFNKNEIINKKVQNEKDAIVKEVILNDEAVKTEDYEKNILNKKISIIKNILIGVLCICLVSLLGYMYHIYKNYDIVEKKEKLDITLYEKNSYRGQDFVTKIYPIFSDVVVVGDSYSYYLGRDIGNDLLIYASEGLTVKQLSNAFEMASKQDREYIFVFIGPNDYREEEKRGQTTLKDFKDELKKHIDLLNEKEKKVLIGSYLESEFTKIGDKQYKIKIKDYDNAIRDVCEENNATYVDLTEICDYEKNKRIRENGEEDWLHFNLEFNIKLINKLYSYIYDMEIEKENNESKKGIFR